MRGNEIVASGDPKGKWLEGIIDDASKPGTWMEVVPGSAQVGGRVHYRHYQPGADGDPREFIILCPDHMQGKNNTDAYVPGTRCFMYSPLHGEYLNVLAQGEAGTGSANAFAVGDRLIGENASGMFIKTTDATKTAAVTVMEHIDEVADTPTLIYCMVA